MLQELTWHPKEITKPKSSPLTVDRTILHMVMRLFAPLPFSNLVDSPLSDVMPSPQNLIPKNENKTDMGSITIYRKYRLWYAVCVWRDEALRMVCAKEWNVEGKVYSVQAHVLCYCYVQWSCIYVERPMTVGCPVHNHTYRTRSHIQGHFHACSLHMPSSRILVHFHPWVQL